MSDKVVIWGMGGVAVHTARWRVEEGLGLLRRHDRHEDERRATTVKSVKG